MKRKYPGVIQCLGCKIILISNSKHDFNKCSCKNETFIAGGYDYIRVGGNDLELIQLLRLSKDRIR